MGSINRLFTHTLRNIIFCDQQKKYIITGLEQIEGK